MHLSALRTALVTCLLLALALVLAAGRALAADAGDLDTSFGGDGIVELNLGSTAEFTDAAVDARRRIVAVGTAGERLDSQLLVVRFTPSGVPDPTFGGGDGIVALDDPLDADEHGLRGGAVLVQPDGKIVAAAGSTGTDAIWYVARLEENGALDPTFANGDGFFSRTVTRESHARVGGILYDAGRIVVAGDVGTGPALMRLTAGGDRDGNFRGGGSFEDRFADGGAELTEIEQDRLGRLLA